MKINNLKNVNLIIRVLAFLMLLNIGFFLLAILLLKSILIPVIIGAIILAEIVFYFRLRYIEFDDSGEVLILKAYHPLKDKIHVQGNANIEIPKNCIEKYVVNGGKLMLWGTHLGRNKPFTIEFRIPYFGNINQNKIDSRLKEYLNRYE